MTTKRTRTIHLRARERLGNGKFAGGISDVEVNIHKDGHMSFFDNDPYEDHQFIYLYKEQAEKLRKILKN